MCVFVCVMRALMCEYVYMYACVCACVCMFSEACRALTPGADDGLATAGEAGAAGADRTVDGCTGAGAGRASAGQRAAGQCAGIRAARCACLCVPGLPEVALPPTLAATSQIGLSSKPPNNIMLMVHPPCPRLSPVH